MKNAPPIIKPSISRHFRTAARNCNRTRHAYYRQLRLLHEYFQCDPRLMTEEKGPKGSKFSDSLCDTTSASRPFVI